MNNALLSSLEGTGKVLSSSGVLAEIPLAVLSQQACAASYMQLLCDKAALAYIAMNALDECMSFTEFELSTIKIQYKFPCTSYVIIKALIYGVSSRRGKTKGPYNLSSF